jgi:uncharacterized protein (UPF0303 family)
MSNADDVKKVIEQEQGLVFPHFDESVAWSIGARLRERAVKDKLGIVVDIRTWDRPMFYMSLPGTTGDNPNWVRRKYNLVQRVMKSSYRVVLEKNWDGDVFPGRRGLDNMDFVLAGGGFPVKVKGAGMIGCITVSGLHERDDHGLVVEAICDELGLDSKSFALGPL